MDCGRMTVDGKTGETDMDIKLTAKNTTEQRVLDYLTANASEVLAEKINSGKKTLSGALDYAKDEAQKLKGGASCVCVDDATVFGWVVHYFEEAHLEEKAEKPKAEVKLPAGVKMVKPPKKVAVAQKAAAAPVSAEQKKSMIELLVGGSVA